MLPSEFVDVLTLASDIYNEKNAQRGGAWESMGLMGAVVGMDRYMARLKTIVLKRNYGQELTEKEIIELTNDFVDTINHACMGFALMRRGRWFIDDAEDVVRAQKVSAVLNGQHNGRP